MQEDSSIRPMMTEGDHDSQYIDNLVHSPALVPCLIQFIKRLCYLLV